MGRTCMRGVVGQDQGSLSLMNAAYLQDSCSHDMRWTAAVSDKPPLNSQVGANRASNFEGTMPFAKYYARFRLYESALSKC